MWRVYLLFFSGLTLVSLVGCPSGSATNNHATQLPLAGQQVEVVAPKAMNLPVAWEVLVQEWSSQSGAATQFTEYDSLDDLAASPQSSGRLLLFPLRDFCNIDTQLTPLPEPSAETFDTRDLFKGLRERVLSRDQQLVAIPISVPVLVCYYRSDLLRAARRKPPETWEEYHELADSLQAWAPGLEAVEPLNSQFRATTFFAKSIAFCKHPENYSVWFDLDTAAPTMNSPGFIEGLRMARRTWRKLSPAVVGYSPEDCRDRLLSGKAAMGLTFETTSAELMFRSSVQDHASPKRVDGIELGICRLPGSRRVFNRNSKKWDTMPSSTVHAPALCGFAGLAGGVLLPGSKSSESAASNLLYHLNSPSVFDQAFASLPKSPSRESMILQAPAWFGPELSVEEASQYADAVAQSLRDTQIVFELPVSGADEFRQAASARLEAALGSDTSDEEILNAMQKDFEAIVERRGQDAVRDSQRRGLGMFPVPKKRTGTD